LIIQDLVAIGIIAFTGTLNGTPVFIGCSDADLHIPVERVHESASVLSIRVPLSKSKFIPLWAIEE
jgi:hypothetical protein